MIMTTKHKYTVGRTGPQEAEAVPTAGEGDRGLDGSFQNTRVV